MGGTRADPETASASARHRRPALGSTARAASARTASVPACSSFALSRAAPELELVCTDYAPRTVDRLQTLFPEATVVQHDLCGRRARSTADFHLLHRVDTEFPTPKLARIVCGFHQPVLLVPSLLLTWPLVIREVLLRLRRPRATRAGWLRSEAAFRALWAADSTHAT